MKNAVITVIGFMLLVAVWSVGSEQYKKHQEIERGRRNTAKYFTVTFAPCAGKCDFQEIDSQNYPTARRECVTDVLFQPVGKDLVFVTYTNLLGVRTMEKASAIGLEPMAIHGGTRTEDGKAKWCEL